MRNINNTVVTKGVVNWCDMNGFVIDAMSNRIPSFSTFKNFSFVNNVESSLTLSIENIDINNKNVLCFQLVLDSCDFGSIVIATIFDSVSASIDVCDLEMKLDIDTSLQIEDQIKLAIAMYIEETAKTNEECVLHARNLLLENNDAICEVLEYIREIGLSLRK